MKTIPLTQGKVALVDDEDYERVNQKKWHIQKSYKSDRYSWYAVHETKSTGKRLMHRFILNLNKGDTPVDHVSGNGLDNRKKNLRIAPLTFNQGNAKICISNTSGLKGVYWHKGANKWCAQICFRSIRRYLGLFIDSIDAARAYDDAAREHFGEFARVNFPGPGEQGCRE